MVVLCSTGQAHDERDDDADAQGPGYYMLDCTESAYRHGQKYCKGLHTAGAKHHWKGCQKSGRWDEAPLAHTGIVVKIANVVGLGAEQRLEQIHRLDDCLEHDEDEHNQVCGRPDCGGSPKEKQISGKRHYCMIVGTAAVEYQSVQFFKEKYNSSAIAMRTCISMHEHA